MSQVKADVVGLALDCFDSQYKEYKEYKEYKDRGMRAKHNYLFRFVSQTNTSSTLSD
jgi:hypothetical protein